MSPRWSCGVFSKTGSWAGVPWAQQVCPLCSLSRQVALSSSTAETVLSLSILGHVTLHPIFLGCTFWWLEMNLQDEAYMLSKQWSSVKPLTPGPSTTLINSLFREKGLLCWAHYFFWKQGSFLVQMGWTQGKIRNFCQFKVKVFCLGTRAFTSVYWCIHLDSIWVLGTPVLFCRIRYQGDTKGWITFFLLFLPGVKPIPDSINLSKCPWSHRLAIQSYCIPTNWSICPLQ